MGFSMFGDCMQSAMSAVGGRKPEYVPCTLGRTGKHEQHANWSHGGQRRSRVPRQSLPLWPWYAFVQIMLQIFKKCNNLKSDVLQHLSHLRFNAPVVEIAQSDFVLAWKIISENCITIYKAFLLFFLSVAYTYSALDKWNVPIPIYFTNTLN